MYAHTNTHVHRHWHTETQISLWIIFAWYTMNFQGLICYTVDMLMYQCDKQKGQWESGWSLFWVERKWLSRINPCRSWRKIKHQTSPDFSNIKMLSHPLFPCCSIAIKKGSPNHSTKWYLKLGNVFLTPFMLNSFHKLENMTIGPKILNYLHRKGVI